MHESNDVTLDVLHIASFVGNVGDNANHNGTWRLLSKNLPWSFKIEEREMRKYYQNYTRADALSFDDSFIQLANEMDLVIVGGGSFFDFWLEESASGTTIDLTNEQIERIDTPLVFHGLGSIPGVDISDSIIERFRTFLKHLFECDNCLVSVRNDGSRGHIREYLGDEYADQLWKIPDGGFFVNTTDSPHPEIPDTDTVIASNIVSDMQERRFPGSPDHITYKEYVTEFASFADSLLDRGDTHLVFVPHIYSDLNAISDVLSEMDLWHRRKRVTTAPYLNGPGSEQHIFNLYENADISIGLRFHANVCSIGLGTPSIGLTNGHPKVGDLYQDLGFADRTVPVNELMFSQNLERQIHSTIDQQEEIKSQYRQTVEDLRSNIDKFHDHIVSLIKNNR